MGPLIPIRELENLLSLEGSLLCVAMLTTDSLIPFPPSRARDYALKSAASSCKRLRSLWYPNLMQNVTLTIEYIYSFHSFLTRHEDDSKLVKTLHFSENDRTGEYMDLFFHDRKAAVAQLFGKDEQFNLEAQRLELSVRKIYDRLVNLEVVVLSFPFGFFPFQVEIDGRSAPHPLLTSSLKKLSIDLWRGSRLINLTGSNVAFLLIFCPHLEEASLSFDLSSQDFKYFSDHQEAFAGSSKIRKLALGIDFVFGADEKTWWDLLSNANKSWKGGNKRTEALIDLLNVTSNLVALEVAIADTGSLSKPKETDTKLSTSFLSSSSLNKSFKSLKHLRLLDVGVDPDFPSLTQFSTFKSMRILTLDLQMLKSLVRFPQISLPSNLEVLCLPYYSVRFMSYDTDFQEEILLSQILQDAWIPKLIEVVVPKKPVAPRAGYLVNERQLKSGMSWEKPRECLENLALFTSGRVKLRLIEEGEDGELSYERSSTLETLQSQSFRARAWDPRADSALHFFSSFPQLPFSLVGDAIKGEVFFSSLTWLSPPL